jgi:hypothetical protein
MPRQYPAIGRIVLPLLASMILAACASTLPSTEGHHHQTALLGMSRSQLLACAGAPTRESLEGDSALFRYYREAPMLEESIVSSKGSHAGVHKGCWATVVIRAEQVEAVRYRFVPGYIDASNHCEEIFANCPQ